MTKKKRRIPLPLKCFLVVLILLIAAGTALCIYVKQKTNPDRMVNDYLKTFMSKDVPLLYEKEGFTDSTFINADTFATCLEECHQYSTIETYSLVKYEDPDNSEQIEYEIQYWSNHRTNPYTQELILKKSEKKLYLLFNQWEIDHSEFLATRCTLSVPNGAAVSVDDIPLAEENIQEQTDESSICEMGNLFIGTHTIKVEMDGFEPFTTTVSLESSDYSDNPIYTITPSMFSVSEETEKELAKTTKKLIQGIYSAAFQNKDFSELTSTFTFEETTKSALQQAYTTLITNNIATDTHLTDVNFTNFDSSCSSSYAEDHCYAISVNSDVDYTSSSVIMNGTATRSRTTGGSSSFTTVFHYRSGVWSVYSTTVLDSCVFYIKY
jgi:hypothetical protein